MPNAKLNACYIMRVSFKKQNKNLVMCNQNAITQAYESAQVLH